MLNLISLQCATCGKALEGDECSLLFYCPICQAKWLFTGGKLVNFEPLQALPEEIIWPDKYELLPFWTFTTDTLADGRRLTIYVPAFFTGNVQQFGNIGWELTREQPLLFVSAIKKALWNLVQRDIQECRAEAQALAWVEINKISPIALDYQPQLADGKLLFLPFATEKSEEWALIGGQSHFCPVGMLRAN